MATSVSRIAALALGAARRLSNFTVTVPVKGRSTLNAGAGADGWFTVAEIVFPAFGAVPALGAVPASGAGAALPGALFPPDDEAGADVATVAGGGVPFAGAGTVVAVTIGKGKRVKVGIGSGGTVAISGVAVAWSTAP